MAISVGELVERAELGATAVAGQRGLDRQVNVPRIQKPGLALTGWPEQLHEGRVLVLGGTEIEYLAEGAYPGLVYFVADLNPAPIAADEYDGSTLTEAGIQPYLTDFRVKVLPQTHALLTFTLEEPEAQYFLRRYPSARQVKLRYARQDYFVLLRRLAGLRTKNRKPDPGGLP